ncbi:Glycosyltransferase involved in cell wall bisynthesis [Hymenobacter gelipurpurascens]|uniref:Glycosyltransferase involved in cell wall bisynthesis n=1 Tax=Hymenobacter gelipurpurascens TaxID=89968 RepID=A0A212UH07_9BACT|nr:glycosyltransferase [Hymenobacter gelipurpurascens]SNC77532.1 Glycosyltransferase involved in cell wall bisynthesis [Hymenobacter gelipurpurascens]
MKVLHVIADMDPVKGGVCQAVRSMVAGLSQLGIQNEVVSLDAPSAPFLSIDPFPIHALGPASGPWQYSARLLPWLYEQLPSYDKVLVHGLWLYPGFAVRQALKKLPQHSAAISIPDVFILPHGMLDPYFQRAANRKWKALRNSLYWRLLESKLINRAEGIFFTSADELLLARQPFRPYSPRQEQVVGLGIPSPPACHSSLKQAFSTKCPEVEAEPYLLYLGRLHEKKGVKILLDAYAQLLNTQPQEEAADACTTYPACGFLARLPKLVIAGPGLDTAYGRELRRLVHDTPGMQRSVLFPGMLQGEAKWGAYYGCELFVLPSHQENFGIAVVEALACGRPVMISNQINIWREIAAGKSGLVADDTVQGTADALKQWLTMSPEQKQLMGKHARQVYENQFAMDRAATKLLAALSG